MIQGVPSGACAGIVGCELCIEFEGAVCRQKNIYIYQVGAARAPGSTRLYYTHDNDVKCLCFPNSPALCQEEISFAMQLK